jgi:hypothetical protein
MEGLVEHGYTGIDPRSKVRYLLDGIKTDKFDAVKTRIMSDKRLRVDFDSCVTLYQNYIRQTSKSKSNAAPVNISELKTGKRKHDAVEDRYYTKEEYTALTPDQKRDLASKRLKRGHKSGAKDGKVNKGTKGKEGKAEKNKELIRKAVTRQVYQLAKQLGKAAVNDVATAASDDSDSSDDEKSKGGTNRSNPSLSRQKKLLIADTRK